MNDFFSFRRMLTPWIIRIGYILGVIIFWLVGLYDIIALQQVILGLTLIILSPILLRLVLEIFMVYFTVNETLTDIRNILREKSAEK